MKHHEQVITLTAAMGKVMVPVPVDKINEYNEGMLKLFDRKFPQIGEEIDRSGKLDEELKKQILDIADKYIKKKLKRDAQDGK